jgi:endonuclease/exonuclease/phosphatase family metal-dependent hydrolase
MMIRLWNIVCPVTLLLFSVVIAQQVSVGDTLRLVERDLHIPGHPAPGDSLVNVRFVSGTTVTVQAIDAETGWLEVQGETLQGERTSAWITLTYLATEDVPVTDETSLAWCPPKRSPLPHPSGRLRIATWNLENLHALDGQSVYLAPDPSVKRAAIDYERIKCYVRLFDPDILAVQEVDGEEALSRVVDLDVYDVHVSSRLRGSLNGKQNTGFAYKRGLNVVPQDDFTALDVDGNGALRYGTRIDLTFHSRTVKLMSVHLKSGCFENSSTSSACPTLERQIPVLETWMDETAQQETAFIVLGDFNRRLNQPGDEVWTELDDGQPLTADLFAVTEDMPIACRSDMFTEFIDHIVFDRSSAPWVDTSSFRHLTYRQQDKEEWNKISDHCPVVVELWIP